jgi:hypothetical protein
MVPTNIFMARRVPPASPVAKEVASRYAMAFGYEDDPPCLNYWLCESEYDNHPGGTRAGVKKLCINCDMMFGKELELTDVSECPVCMKDECLGCVFPYCTHVMCRDCFKRMQYGPDDDENEPKFPYNSEIEEEYAETQDEDPKWDLDPLIIQWRDDWNEWDDARQPTDNLRKCPICRSCG